MKLRSVFFTFLCLLLIYLSWSFFARLISNDQNLDHAYTVKEKGFSLPLPINDSQKLRSTLINDSEAGDSIRIKGVDINKLHTKFTSPNNFTWLRSNGDNGSRKFSSLEEISLHNVSDLEVAWEYKADSHDWEVANIETNPIEGDGKLFITTLDGNLIALDSSNGRKIWVIRLPGPIARRGMIYVKSSKLDRSRIFVPTSQGIFSVFADSGDLDKKFGKGGVAGNELSLVAPIYTGTSIVTATSKPSIKAYDSISGLLIWERSLIKADSKHSGGIPWSGMSYDAQRNLIYVSTGNPRPSPVGISRPGNNDFSCSIVAIDASNGSINWSFQEVRHDLWDLDIPSPPLLTTINKNGKPVDVVVAVTKTGNTLVLDRDYGQPIFDYLLKKVPASKIPGEITSSYQPDFNLPQPFTKQVFSSLDVDGLSLISRLDIKRKIRNSKYGFYEPPQLGGDIVYYGVNGGAEWPGGAVNPSNNFLYIPSKQVPWQIRVGYKDLYGETRNLKDLKGNNLYQEKCAGCHGAKLEGTSASKENKFRYAPSLIGETFLSGIQYMDSLQIFHKNHSGLIVNIDKSQLDQLKSFFLELDNWISKDTAFSYDANWRPLLDQDGRPGIAPPWVYLTAIDLSTGRKVWRVPYGEYSGISEDETPLQGGVIATKGGLLFGTGTKDAFLYAFDQKTGRVVWRWKMDRPGSATPMTYIANGHQYLVVVTSRLEGGASVHALDHITAFRLKRLNREIYK